MIATLFDCLIVIRHCVIWHESECCWRRSSARSVHLVGAGGTLVVSVLSGEEDLSRLVNGELGDLAVRRVNRNVSRLAVLAFLGQLIDVDAPSSSVDGHDLADGTKTTLLLAASSDLNNVVLADGNRAALVLVLKVLVESAAHELSADAARGGEVSLSGLSSRAGNGYKQRKI